MGEGGDRCEKNKGSGESGCYYRFTKNIRLNSEVRAFPYLGLISLGKMLPRHPLWHHELQLCPMLIFEHLPNEYLIIHLVNLYSTSYIL